MLLTKLRRQWLVEGRPAPPRQRKTLLTIMLPTMPPRKFTSTRSHWRNCWLLSAHRPHKLNLKRANARPARKLLTRNLLGRAMGAMWRKSLIPTSFRLGERGPKRQRASRLPPLLNPQTSLQSWTECGVRGHFRSRRRNTKGWRPSGLVHLYACCNKTLLAN